MRVARPARLAAALLAAACLWFDVAGSGSAGEAGIPPFDGNAGWLNSPPLQASDLHGKIVLVDFWEYTCVNCLRTLPYLREWYRRYRADGFTIVGVHAPEFGFSGDAHNIADASKRLGVTWPVVLDNDFNIWKRYANDGWPHEYLFDGNGTLVDSVSGEGRYPETEAKIQALIKASAPQKQLPPVMALLPQDSYDKPGAVCYPKTDEVLVERAGVANATAFNSGPRDSNYNDAVGAHKDGALYLQGYWRATEQAVVSASSDGYVALKYHAMQLLAVMKSEDGGSTRVDVTQDGQPLAHVDAGSDIRYDASGKSYVDVEAPRAYELVSNAKFGQHELRLMPQKYGVGVYSFAFESCEAPSALR